MSTKLRMARRGTTNRPFYHLVAADSRAPRDGEYLEKLGTYNPLEQDTAKRLTLVTDRVKYWLSVGAQPSDRVAKLLAQAGLAKAPKITDKPLKSAPKKRAQERAAEKAEKEAALQEAANAPAETPAEEPAAEAPAAEAASEETAA